MNEFKDNYIDFWNLLSIFSSNRKILSKF